MVQFQVKQVQVTKKDGEMKSKKLKKITYNNMELYIHREFEDILIVSKSQKEIGLFSIKKEK